MILKVKCFTKYDANHLLDYLEKHFAISTDWGARNDPLIDPQKNKRPPPQDQHPAVGPLPFPNPFGAGAFP